MSRVSCHSERSEESLINCAANVRTHRPEMFRFAQHDRQTAVRFFS
jgi:hypothetical protein